MNICIIGHSAIVCKTTLKLYFLIEYTEGAPILIHDVTKYFAPNDQIATFDAFGYHFSVESR